METPEMAVQPIANIMQTAAQMSEGRLNISRLAVLAVQYRPRRDDECLNVKSKGISFNG